MMTVKEPLGIEAFVRAYSDEDAPACLITLRERTESTASESHPYPDITASNSCFTDAHKEQLMRASSRLEQEKVLRTGEMRWSVTKVAPSDEAVHVSTLVCLGRREKRTIPEGSTHTASRSPRKKDRASQQVPRTKGHGTKSSQAEEYRQRWSGMSVAGTDRIAFLQHLDLILGVDWARTPLGPMSTWSTALLSLLGQCLASPFPVLFAWGPELTQLYNLPYSVNIGQKHPANLGKAYRDAWPEMWDHISEPLNDALKGKATRVVNEQMYLQRKGYLEECYFTWSISPVFDDDGHIAGVYIPYYENTLAVVTERRVKLLREASQATEIETKPVELYTRICKATADDLIDLPLLVFYDTSAADEETDLSDDHWEKFHDSLSHPPSEGVPEDTSSTSHRSQDAAKDVRAPPRSYLDSRKSQHDLDQHGQGKAPALSPYTELTAGRGGEGIHEAPQLGSGKGSGSEPKVSDGEVRKRTAKPLRNLIRAANSGCGENSKLFPLTIPPPTGEEEETSIATHPTFLMALRKVQNTHQHLILQKEDMEDFVEYLDKTSLGDDIITIALLPIVTSDDVVRGICIVGLNPRNTYGEDYQLFLDLFHAQVNHGVTNIRLIGEELRRSTFYAALVKRKNEELLQVLDARTEELRSSERKIVKMAEVCPSGIWTINSFGNITFVNEAWYTITGYPRERPIDDWPEMIRPEDKERTLAWFDRMLSSTEPIQPLEFRCMQSPGDTEQRWTWADARHEVGENGEIVSVTGTLTDITIKKSVEVYQRQRAEEAIQMRRAQEGFIDTTSHELRNPLSAISLACDSTTERLEHILNSDDTIIPTSQYKGEMQDTLQDMKIISHCCVHMTRLIDDVLTLSKIDNHFLVITPVPCRPTDFISETLAVFKAEMRSKKISYELKIEPSFAENNVDYVLTDPSRINQVVINMLTNAIKFTATAKVRKIKVTLDCSQTRPATVGTAIRGSTLAKTTESDKVLDAAELYLVVSISDTGRGLTEEEIGHLFQRFRQANSKTHISYGGSGLGLHICKRIAELLGGEVGVESVRGQGSTFTFWVPTKRSSPAEGTTSSADPKSSAVAIPAQKSTSRPPASVPDALRQSLGSSAEEDDGPENLAILIVEDNLVNQKLLDRHLKKVGCITTCANHGREAIDRINQSKWVSNGGPPLDCVLMDIEMPVMDGLTAIRELRQMEARGEVIGHVPVLAVTANARQEQLQNMMQSGFDGTVSKPFKIPVIMERVRSLLLQQRQQADPSL